MKKIIFILLICSLSAFALPPDSKKSLTNTNMSASIDNANYINANKIMMFVTNHGNFGRDFSGVFGYDYGTWYPYTGNSDDILNNINGAGDKSPLYAAGLWIGGKINDSVRVAISEYASEYVSGPMLNGTFQSDSPEFKVYKLYIDSLVSNPNDDYTNWPISQGAPVDEQGRPLMRGDQMLWTVYNDADPNQHTEMLSKPLGIEIQQTVWAQDEDGNDSIPYNYDLDVTQIGIDNVIVEAYISEPMLITGDEYQITFKDTFYVIEEGYSDTVLVVWNLDNIITNQRILENQRTWYWGNRNSVKDTLEGLSISVELAAPEITTIEVIANADGAIVPSVSGALHSQGFITPDSQDPGESQQAGDGKWAIHTYDNGGSCDFGNRFDFELFSSSVFPEYYKWESWFNDYELRFTGSYNNPEVDGGYILPYPLKQDPIIDTPIWVPFEIWNIGINTPDDTSDDIRMMPYYISENGNDLFNLQSWGCRTDLLRSGGDGEHSASSENNDPYTDAFNWMMPHYTELEPGEYGYNKILERWNAGTMNRNTAGYEKRIFNMSLINLDGHLMAQSGDTLTNPPQFTQDLPELGTIFRINTNNTNAPTDTFTFTSKAPDYIATGPDGVSLYMMYKLFNKGGNQIDSCFVSFWSDPDLGRAGNDLVGCDTLSDIHFCYDSDETDAIYKSYSPAIGFKVIHGPLVPSNGSSAMFDETVVEDYKNLSMSSFMHFQQGADPDNEIDTYEYMKGFARILGQPYVYNGDTLTYMYSGDPVTGTGDLDIAPSDRRMFGTVGPFDFAPGDSQYVLVKMTVGQGTDYLNSITRMKEILNVPYQIPTDINDDKPKQLPLSFTLAQNYPNPFNPTTQIKFTLPVRSDVTLEIFNLLGQKVTTLIDKNLSAGSHSIDWDASQVSTGIYFYKLTVGDFVLSKKMMLLK